MSKVDPNVFSNAVSNWESTAPINDVLNQKVFRKHMLDNHGIKVGVFTSDHIVVDEKKYMMCVLRWS